MGLKLKRQLTYDPACYTLAKHFLGDTFSDDVVKELAADIQWNIELWINYDERISNPVKAGKA